MRTPARWIVAFLPGLPKLGHGQKGLGSLNDPCDCMQHHDFWVASRRALVELFWTPDYPMRALDPNDKLHYWTRRQSCMYSPENEESHRPTALSDCIPGFMMVTIVCMQRHVASGNPERAMDFATELVRLLPFGASCIDTSGWPVTTSQILSYYRRFRRAYAAGPKGQGLDVAGRRERTEQRERDGGTASGWPVWLLREMLWQAGTERSSGRLLGEEAETCPSGSFPHKWRCWLLGVPGASCEEACREAELDFRPFPPSPPPMGAEFPEPLVPHILGALHGGKSPTLHVQHPWAPFECYVQEEQRFHLSASWQEQDASWRYPICSLACPCAPFQPLASVLEAVPVWPSIP